MNDNIIQSRVGRRSRKAKLGETSAVPLVRELQGRYATMRPLTDTQFIEAAIGLLEARFDRSRPVIAKPEASVSYLRLKLAPLDYEVFGVVLLNNRHRVVSFEAMFRGTIDNCTVHPREVVKLALQNSAVALLIFHNHPGGKAEPSRADEQLTRQLQTALSLIDVRILDHIIVTLTGYYSFAESGLL
jgi:DNA repair protein RadC